jgi:hypothetical protein
MPEGRAGWQIAEYFPGLTGFGSTATWYVLPDWARPRHFRIGGRVVIIERPTDYMQRLEHASRERAIRLGTERRKPADQ